MSQDKGLEEKLQGGNQPRQEEVQVKKEYALGNGFSIGFTEEQAREILLNPKRFGAEYDRLTKNKNKITLMGMLKPEDITRALIMNVQEGENEFLKNVIEAYLPFESKTSSTPHDSVRSSYMVRAALDKMTLKDDTYFKTLFEKSDCYATQNAAFWMINDFDYVKAVILETAKSNTQMQSPAACFISSRGSELYNNDPAFIDSLAENSVDPLIREAAIGATSNMDILRKYSSLTDKECDQYQNVPGSQKADQAFLNEGFRRAARYRLKELQK